MSKQVKISGIVITFNEEKNIERCLRSVQGVCDEIIVIDAYSQDNTKSIAESLGAKVIQNHWKGFLNQKNFAQDKATHDFVLQLDADEVLSKQLQESILDVKKEWKYIWIRN